MIIRYPKGESVEGFLLSRDQKTMRVALEGCSDAAEFIEVQGNWLSENLEPVEIAFEWQRQPQQTPAQNDSDFICPPDLAAHLIRLLATDSDAEEKRRPKHLTAGRSIM